MVDVGAESFALHPHAQQFVHFVARVVRLGELDAVIAYADAAEELVVYAHVQNVKQVKALA